MNYKIYIQSVNNFPISEECLSAYVGFRDKQANIIFFEDIEEVPVSKSNIVVGYIEDTNKYFEKLGLGPKLALNIPDELISYTGRNIRFMTMKEFKDNEKCPVFVKPNRKSKEFVAGVVSKDEYKFTYFNDVHDETPVLVSDVVNFISEYRGYVIKGELKGIKHYLGDFRVFPDMLIVDEAIKDYITQPSAYSIDFGVTDDGRTLLVECNDGWSLGNYGLDNTTYSTLLSTRWLELMRSIPSL